MGAVSGVRPPMVLLGSGGVLKCLPLSVKACYARGSDSLYVDITAGRVVDTHQDERSQLSVLTQGG